MSAWVVLATCGPAAIVSVLAIAAICRAATAPNQTSRPYITPPLTDEYVNAELAVIEWNWQKGLQP